ncbi:MAG: hypothetical protein CMB80_31785, partial [Flammeovirgaceae bacterium]|nr:hypothetical protein [Flammeovirgaceae bacterium]
QYKYGVKHLYTKYLMHLPIIRELRALPFYKRYRDLHTLIDFFLPFNKLETSIADFKFPIYYGEHRSTEIFPVIRKARKITDKYGILYDLRSLRYNSPCYTVMKNDIDWSEKNNDVIWRGATTGEQLVRETFVQNYHTKYNVGFSTSKQKPHLADLVKERISIADQLKSKFIVSLQGNDLASNIRWVLYSNSVPIMPKPKWTSWTMETKLEPNVHYLELNDDLSNLDELLAWASKNDKECQQIALNGKSYAAQFLDRDYDTRLRLRLLEEYANRLKIIK